MNQTELAADALLPCPFCGNGARMLKREIGIKGRANWDWWHSIQCAKCNAAVGYDDNRYRDKGDCARAWNTRTPDLAKMVDDMRVAKEALEKTQEPEPDWDAIRYALTRLKPYEKLFEKEGDR